MGLSRLNCVLFEWSINIIKHPHSKQNRHVFPTSACFHAFVHLLSPQHVMKSRNPFIFITYGIKITETDVNSTAIAELSICHVPCVQNHHLSPKHSRHYLTPTHPITSSLPTLSQARLSLERLRKASSSVTPRELTWNFTIIFISTFLLRDHVEVIFYLFSSTHFTFHLCRVENISAVSSHK